MGLPVSIGRNLPEASMQQCIKEWTQRLATQHCFFSTCCTLSQGSVCLPSESVPPESKAQRPVFFLSFLGVDSIFLQTLFTGPLILFMLINRRLLFCCCCCCFCCCCRCCCSCYFMLLLLLSKKSIRAGLWVKDRGRRKHAEET